LAIVVVADGSGVTGSLASGVAKKWHETVSSLGVPLGYRCSYSAGQNHSYTILFSSTTGRK
jgi:hypothetical protein